jgi:CspA family cold shock protein
METGTVKYFNAIKGYGFIQRDAGGHDVYVALTSIPHEVRALYEGQRVQFRIEEGKRGPEAKDVKVIG